ncbi:MAG: CDC27 family protein [Hydrogenimonas sp.]|nr:CDC27 family protein [Hydrogenimonas sp.]
MLEIEKLEKEWRRYKLKQLKIPVVFVSVFFIAILLFFTTDLFVELENKTDSYLPTSSDKELQEANRSETITKNLTKSTPIAKTSKESLESPAASTEEVEKQKKDLVTSAVSKEKSESPATSAKKADESIELSPDTEFLDSFLASEPIQRPIREQVFQTDVRSVLKQENKRVAGGNEEKKKASQMEENEQESSTSNIVISSNKTNNALSYLIKKYKERRDPKLASYIANSFYKKGKYKEAIKWSVEANSVDPSSEESWIIFAKANAKIGQKEKAIKALRVYLNQYSSKNVKSLLKSLESK